MIFGKALTGSEYPYVQYGKPTKATYRFAERLLRDRLRELQGADTDDFELPNVQVPSLQTLSYLRLTCCAT